MGYSLGVWFAGGRCETGNCVPGINDALSTKVNWNPGFNRHSDSGGILMPYRVFNSGNGMAFLNAASSDNSCEQSQPYKIPYKRV